MADDVFNPEGIVVVRIPVGLMPVASMCLNRELDTNTEEKAIFKVLTYGDYDAVSRASEVIEVRPDGSLYDAGNPFEFDRNMLYRCLISTTMIDGKLKREGGWLNKDSRELVVKLPGPIVRFIVDQYRLSYAILEQEDKALTIQSHMLFSARGQVSDPLPAISKFCNMSAFAEKFNMSMHNVEQMSFSDFIRLRKVMDAEADAARRKAKPNNGATSSASFGGQKSRGKATVIPDMG
jgi:hypothetical protein